MTDLMKGLRFKVGDTAWYATWGTRETYERCPHCLGDGRLRVIFADDVEVSIACRNCSSGYDPPTGWVKVYQFVAEAEEITIHGFEVEGEKMTWRAYAGPNSYRILDDDRLFTEEAPALLRASAAAAEHEQAERERVLKKHKDTRSWAWNASYHRNQIKDHERQLEYHCKALAAASLRAKEK